ncbi:hypothetical protein FH972_014420 [Carpinus fangiana]|uniref:Uncharacterized protein n=1 Tax=Carpinus fangiana TaxID=176857 RepID=A0A5N6RCX3_9ROSI|nr:hypothetical protein FH972_014420 [Carpinus fangiana]
MDLADSSDDNRLRCTGTWTGMMSPPSGSSGSNTKLTHISPSDNGIVTLLLSIGED